MFYKAINVITLISVYKWTMGSLKLPSCVICLYFYCY